jgi:hypothetical protein
MKMRLKSLANAKSRMSLWTSATGAPVADARLFAAVSMARD